MRYSIEYIDSQISCHNTKIYFAGRPLAMVSL